MGRAQPGCRLFALGAVVSDGRLWGTGGPAAARSGEARVGPKGEDQDCGEPRCQPRLQPLASMRPRPLGTRSPPRNRTPPDRGSSRQQQSMVSAGSSVKSAHGSGRALAAAPAWHWRHCLLRWMLRRRSQVRFAPGGGFGYIRRHRDLRCAREAGRPSRRLPLRTALDRNPANYAPLTPISFIERAADGLSAAHRLGPRRHARHLRGIPGARAQARGSACRARSVPATPSP